MTEPHSVLTRDPVRPGPMRRRASRAEATSTRRRHPARTIVLATVLAVCLAALASVALLTRQRGHADAPEIGPLRTSGWILSRTYGGVRLGMDAEAARSAASAAFASTRTIHAGGARWTPFLVGERMKTGALPANDACAPKDGDSAVTVVASERGGRVSAISCTIDGRARNEPKPSLRSRSPGYDLYVADRSLADLTVLSLPDICPLAPEAGTGRPNCAQDMPTSPYSYVVREPSATRPGRTRTMIEARMP